MRANVIGIKIIITLFVFGGILMGGLGLGANDYFSKQTGELLHMFYLIFETVGRGLFVIIGGLLTLNIFNHKKQANTMRRRSIYVFMFAMFCLLILLPIFSGYWEFVLALMPFPWSSFPLQIIYDGHYFTTDVAHAFNGNGVLVLVITYLLWNMIVFIGVIKYGRRFFCSMLCPNVGCHSETMREAIPLFTSLNDKIGQKILTLLRQLKWVIFVTYLLIILIWSVTLILGDEFVSISSLRNVEKYMYFVFGLLLMFIGFLFSTGRLYCHYCPAGTMLSMVSKMTGHVIATDNKTCINCGNCDRVCEMSIKIKARAIRQIPVISNQCVGCGACVDICPVGTLSYGGGNATQNLKG